MAIESYTTQLGRVQTAIAAIENNAQSVQTINGRAYSYANIDSLYAKEKWLRKMVERESDGGIKIRGGTPV